MEKATRAACRYLKGSKERLGSWALAAAAYNMGEGKVSRLISQADTLGLDATRWDNVATLLPPGHHTISYVNNVLDTYQYYSRLYPR